MPFQDPNKTILFPSYEIEQILKKIFPAFSTEDVHIVAFLFEVYEEYRNRKVAPDIAFVAIFDKWCRKYKSHPFVLEQLETYTSVLIPYLVKQAQRELEDRQKQEWIEALKKHISVSIYSVPPESKVVSLTK